MLGLSFGLVADRLPPSRPPPAAHLISLAALGTAYGADDGQKALAVLGGAAVGADAPPRLLALIATDRRG